MSKKHDGATAKPARVLAWCAFLTLTLMLALMLQALAVSALGTPGTPTPANVDICATPYSATAALADGDDVRARFVSNLCAEATREMSPH